MNVSITSHFEKFVQDRVKAGRFNNASEVIRAGLRLLEREEKEHEEKLVALRAEIAKGFIGEPVPFNLEEIKTEARKRKNEHNS